MVTRYTITSTGHSESHEEVNNNQDVYKLSVKDAEEAKSPSSEIKDLTTVYELNKNFHIEINEQEDWLCIGKLPRDMGPEGFLGLVQDFGEVQQYFLVVSERTGQSKGYGLVKFHQKSSSIEAKHVLDGQEINGHIIDCDWLKPVPANPSSKSSSGQSTQISLHSKCLYVDNLPEDYRDMGEFRRLFSKIVNPPYCQIALKNGVIQRWGLVEFDSSDDAEATLDLLDGHLINGNPIRVQFCLPGAHAIHIYLNFINNPMAAQAEKKALLEEAPSPKVYDQLNSLAQKNPWFVQSLQKIMSSVSIQDRSFLSKLLPSTWESQTLGSTSPSNGGDPAQAALILLLAGRVSSSSPDQSSVSFLQGILKKLESGENASQILRSILPTSPGQTASTSELIQSALNYSHEAHKLSKPTKEKDPQLTDLLYRSFQAKLARGDYNQKKISNEKRFTPPSPLSRPQMKTVSPIHSEVKPVVEFCFPTGLAPPLPPPQQQPSSATSHFSDGQELQFNPAGLHLPQPPVTNTNQLSDSLHCLSQTSQQAFLTQQGMLQLGQHQMFNPAVFAATQQHSLFSLPAQMMWPAQMSMYPMGTSSYPQHGHTVLPSHILTADPLTAFQQLQNTSYLSRVGLKRPLVSDLEMESKRLRLAAIPF